MVQLGGSNPHRSEVLKFVSATPQRAEAKKSQSDRDVSLASGEVDVPTFGLVVAEAPKPKNQPGDFKVSEQVARAVTEDPTGRNTLTSPGMLAFLKNAPDLDKLALV
ncbi:MAG TPA: hypothetical protein V6C52_01705 [Coleofasciculaceae cyanobacterium]|jgi:hypothetical protein